LLTQLQLVVETSQFRGYRLRRYGDDNERQKNRNDLDAKQSLARHGSQSSSLSLFYHKAMTVPGTVARKSIRILYVCMTALRQEVQKRRERDPPPTEMSEIKAAPRGSKPNWSIWSCRLVAILLKQRVE
jgi:hypothetical protein